MNQLDQAISMSPLQPILAKPGTGMSYKSKEKEIHIGQFIVTGTSNLISANKAIQKLLSSTRCGLKEARYRVDGKTIIIKPRR